jgi:mannose/fructose/N-acetylgalactosamine-specific phosphotransferase system component IIC
MTVLPGWQELVPVGLLAGVVGLDVVSFPQAMLSRPLVGATLGGAFLGEPMAGLVCGTALECLALESLPVGASRYPEWGSASVIAGAVATTGIPADGLPGAGAFTIAVLIGILAAWFGGWTMVQHRRLIARFARPRLDRLAAGDRDTVVGLQLFGMTLDLMRGAMVGVMSFLVARPVAVLVADRWTVSDELTRALIATMVAAVAAAAVWKDFHAISGTRRLFLASLAIGTVLVFLNG